MPKKPFNMTIISRVAAVLSNYPDGIWLRRLAQEAKIPLTTLHRYLDGVLSPFVDNIGVRNDKGHFFGVRLIKLKSGVLSQLEKGLTIEKLLGTRTIYRDIE